MRWRLGVVGDPIEHSLSPLLHETGLRLAGLEGSSQRFQLNESQVGDLRTLLGSVDALSVTMPLKAVAAGVCDELDDVASRLGVVNSLLVRHGEVSGRATDGPGLVDALVAQTGVDVVGAQVVVLGTGSSALAIVDALDHAGATRIQVRGRNDAKVLQFEERFAGVVTMTELDRVDVVINTLPSHARSQHVDLESGVSDRTIAVDITYEPRMSRWREVYEQAECVTMNGLAMLAYQAARQMQWWWNVPIDGGQLLEVLT